MKIKKTLILTIVLLIIFVECAYSSPTKQSMINTYGGNTLYVGGTGPGNFSKIQDAINASSNRDTIYVYLDSSPYLERITIDKKIILKGDEKGRPEISREVWGTVITVLSDEVTINGFNIINTISSGQYFSGIQIESDYNIIRDNKIDNEYGISIISGNHNILYNNTFSDYSTHIKFINSNYNSVIDNVFWGIMSEGYNILLVNSNNNIFYHNNFYEDQMVVSDDGQNIWDNGYPSGGNYWAYFLTTDENNDGICDYPKTIPGGENVDRYPLFYLYGQGNRPPNTPWLSGPTTCKDKEEVIFTFYCFDPEEDDILYQLSWGDGEKTEWFGPYDSGQEVTASHIFYKSNPPFYEIIVQAKDTNGNVSPTFKRTSITVEKSKTLVSHQIFERLVSIFLAFGLHPVMNL